MPMVFVFLYEPSLSLQLGFLKQVVRSILSNLKKTNHISQSINLTATDKTHLLEHKLENKENLMMNFSRKISLLIKDTIKEIIHNAFYYPT